MKSHFLYTKQQRSGILFLFAVILITQLSYHFIDFKDQTTNILDSEESAIFQKQIDSLKKIKTAIQHLKSTHSILILLQITKDTSSECPQKK